MWQRLIHHADFNYALRQTLILSLAMGLGGLAGGLATGLIFGLVPVCSNIAGLDLPHQHFWRRIFAGCLLFSGSALLVGLALNAALPLSLILGALCLLLGVCGAISPLNARFAPAALVAAVVAMSLGAGQPLWKLPLLYVIGTLWYGALTTLWYALWSEPAVRESLARLYRRLADHAEHRYADPAAVGEALSPALLAEQQGIIDLVNLCYQQLYMLSASAHEPVLRQSFQVALDVQEHLVTTLYLPDQASEAPGGDAVRADVAACSAAIARGLRARADALQERRAAPDFSAEPALAALAAARERNFVARFCHYHFERIARVLTTGEPLYARELLSDRSPRVPFRNALRQYLAWRSPALRSALRTGLMLVAGLELGRWLHLQHSYWVLITVLFVTQSGYTATRLRILHRGLGTLAGIAVASLSLRLALPENLILATMPLMILCGYVMLRRSYGIAMIFFTMLAMYSLQLVTHSGADFLLPRALDTVLGCVIAYLGMTLLWPQWQSGLLRRNALELLDAVGRDLDLLLARREDAALANARVIVNQAHNALFNSLDQAMKEPSFSNVYLAEMKLWVTHGQQIVGHLNALTTLTREKIYFDAQNAQDSLQAVEARLQRCRQALARDPAAPAAPLDEPGAAVASPQAKLPQPDVHDPLAHHLQRILHHLDAMGALAGAMSWHQPTRIAWRRFLGG